MKPIDNSKLMNRLITNKLIYDLSSYLSYSYLTSQLRLLCYLVFYQHQQLSRSIYLFGSCSISSFVEINGFVSYNVQFFVNYHVPSFVSTNSFISYSIQFFINCNVRYQAFSFISEHPTGSIGNPEDLLDNLVGLVYLDLLICTELDKFLTILYKSIFKSQGFKAETMQFHLLLLLLLL